MTRVLHITHWFPSGENPSSGCFILDQCHAIQDDGHLASFVLFFDILHPKKLFPDVRLLNMISENGLNISIIKLQWVLSPILYVFPQLQWLFFKRQIKKHLCAIQPDIIHAHVVHPSAALGAKMARVNNLPLVISEHWSNLQSYFRKRWQSAWGKKAYCQARLIFPVSGFLGNTILDVVQGIDPLKVKVVPNIIDSKVFFYTERVVSSKVLKFIMVSHWMRSKHITKRPEIVFEALNRFAKESMKSITLTVVGGGDLLNELKSRATSMSFEVVFTGSLQREEIAELYRNHDFFLHASNIETFSLVTAEALMCGLPAVVSNTGALPDLVPVSRGIVVMNEVNAWVEAIHKVTSTKYNRSEIASEVAHLFSPQQVGEKIREMYNGIIMDI